MYLSKIDLLDWIIMNYHNRLLLEEVSLLFQKKVIKFQSEVLTVCAHTINSCWLQFKQLLY
jgi:hypothetical protein